MSDLGWAPVLAGGGWVAGWVLALDVRSMPEPARSLAAPPTISIVVPARNEARRLPRLLAALKRDGATGDRELIVVDDGSTDQTARLARAAGATVITTEPPDGWTGKSWACWVGASRANGQVLVFLDADTEPSPGFVERLAIAAVSDGGMVSVQPWHRVERAYERLSAIANLVAVLGTGTGRPTRRRQWRRAGGFGPAVAVPRSTYLSRGGHGEVRTAVAEDLALAGHLDARGVRVSCWLDEGIAYRMYPEGADSLVEGWSKNLAAGASSVPPLRAALVAAWITSVLVALLFALALVAELAGVTGLTPAARAMAIAVPVLVVSQAAVLLPKVGRFGTGTALLAPLLGAVFVALFARSTWQRAAGRRPRWRGRIVPEGWA